LIKRESISSFLALYNSKNWDKANLIKTLNNIKKYLQQKNVRNVDIIGDSKFINKAYNAIQRKEWFI